MFHHLYKVERAIQKWEKHQLDVELGVCFCKCQDIGRVSGNPSVLMLSPAQECPRAGVLQRKPEGFLEGLELESLKTLTCTSPVLESHGGLFCIMNRREELPLAMGFRRPLLVTVHFVWQLADTPCSVPLQNTELTSSQASLFHPAL